MIFRLIRWLTILFGFVLIFQVSDTGWCQKNRFCSSLNGDWDFSYTPPMAVNTLEIPPSEQFDSKIQVPGLWDDQIESLRAAKWFPQTQFQGEVPYLVGIGWYRKEIDIPRNWRGRIITLEIRRAIGKIHIWLNRQSIGQYDYGFYTPYEVNLTGLLEYGQKNELVISVDNSQMGAFSECWSFFWPHRYSSGITDSVSLNISSGPGRIADVYLRPGENLKEAVWEAELEALKAQNAESRSKLIWEVRDNNHCGLLAQGEVAVPAFERRTQVVWKTRVEGIEPWSPRHPRLYRAHLRWVDSDQQEIDRSEDRFGLRRLSYQGRKLFLNGEPLYLRGEFGMYYYPKEGCVPTDKEFWLTNMKRAKEIGMNYLNFAAQVCPIEMMEAADELGLILQCGDHITVLENYRDLYRDVWPPIVRLTRNYPSLCILGFGGERNYYEGAIEQYAAQYRMIKSLHPEVLVMPQQAIRGIDYAFDEQGGRELTQEPFPHHAQRLARYTETCDLFGHYSCVALSYSFDQPPHWQEMNERFRIYNRPLSAHELSIAASYLNPAAARKYTGRIPPLLYTMTESALREAGLLDRWKTYAENSERLLAIGIKYNIEKARKCDDLAGYEFLGMTDMHIFYPKTFSVGMMNEFLELKTGLTKEMLLQCNGESVLLIDYDQGASLNRAFWEDDPFEADILISHYGEQDLHDAILTWTLRDGKDARASNIVQIPGCKTGFTRKIHRIQLTWPKVDKTTRVNLRLELKNQKDRISNQWDFWVFPKLPIPHVSGAADEVCLNLLGKRFFSMEPLTDASNAKLRILSEIRESDVDHLIEGGDVLLLGFKPFEVNKAYTEFRCGLGARTFQHFGRVIHNHPIFEHLPHEGWGNWHFYSIFQGAPSILFDEMVQKYGVDFDPIVEVISSPSDVKKLAGLFEKRVGRGRLFVAATQFDLENPACVTLLESILRYVQSDVFRPKTEISVDCIRDWVFRGGPLEKASQSGQTSDEKALQKEKNSLIWSREAVGLKFESDIYYRIDEGEWQIGREVKVSHEGAHRVSIKRSEADVEVDIREVNIDTTSPRIEILAKPSIDQEGGFYTAAEDTILDFRASDSLSGVNSLEYSIDDGTTYQFYAGAFSISSGRYIIRCRATDFAGNRNDVIVGADMTGGPTNRLELQVK